ncbi:MFS family permease [Mycetocola sp. BIGb0189]|uniref:MFS transporter n=1 Tax=Mycetocola sp. BIGb0189 TaxID=2940604 RepID=UPI002169F3FC|nr:MFS transporter [Mycetocola sp. BIGb0189]MCS4276268.1 MFS family permease [Mycetocola sp. BIGb0189]
MKWTQPWYVAYALVGMMMLGVAPIFIPLSVEDGGKNGATLVGVVVAAFYAGGLLAPVLGSLADRKGLQRGVFLWSFPVMALAMIGFAFASNVWIWVPLALIFGGAGSLAGTVAGLFIVEARPMKEWNNRLSWFRLAYGVGQVVGLIIAALAATQLRFGWILSAVLLATGFFLGRAQLPRLKPAAPAQPSTRTSGVATLVRGKIGVFLLTWLLTMMGVQTFFNVVPLVMRDAFAVTPSMSSILFLIGAALGTLCYPLAGTVANKTGPGAVLLLGVGASIIAFGSMAIAAMGDVPGKAVIGSAALVVAATAYSFEVVAATLMVVKIYPGPEGSAMGLLNGIIALGAVLGALVPSFLAQAFGYSALPAFACGVLVLAALAGLPLYRRSTWRGAAPAPTGVDSTSTR